MASGGACPSPLGIFDTSSLLKEEDDFIYYDLGNEGEWSPLADSRFRPYGTGTCTCRSGSWNKVLRCAKFEQNHSRPYSLF